MKRFFLFVTLVSLVTASYLIKQNVSIQAPSTLATQPTTPSCANPTAEIAQQCAKMEQQILASTVRLETYLWREGSQGKEREYLDGGVSHATVKDGRYLVTHNHFHIPLNQQAEEELIMVSVYRANGDIILQDVPLTAFTVVKEDEETLLLDFQAYVGQGLFEMIGMPSAEFRSWNLLPLQPGMEVAQVDWDGTTTHVDWVRVERVLTNDHTPQVELVNQVMPGASGGGIFWNGYHIGNNWFDVTAREETSGYTVYSHSVAALDSVQMVAVIEVPAIAQ